MCLTSYKFKSMNKHTIHKVSKHLSSMERAYKQCKHPIKFNFREFVTSNLSIKRSDVFTHSIHKYPGRLFPYIPITFLSSEKYCPRDGTVLDTFAGSGTVLLESIVNPFFKREVYGVEINPLGRLISKVKTTPLNPVILEEREEKLFSILQKRIYASDYHKCLPSFSNIDLWFSPKAKRGLAKIRFCIEQLEEDKYRDFFWVCFSSLIRSISKADPFVPPPVLLKLDKYKNSDRYQRVLRHLERADNPDTLGIFKNVVHGHAKRMSRLWDIDEIRRSTIQAKVIWDDARNVKKATYNGLGKLKKSYSRDISNSISIIISSPPYLSAQKYVRTTSLEMLWLGMTTEEDIRDLHRATIGNEKVSLSWEKNTFDIPQIDDLLNRLGKLSQQRMITASEYFKEMYKTFECSYRILKKDGRMILVLGNNKVCGINVNTSQLVSLLAHKAGFEELCVFKDEIRTRGMITKRHDSGGLIKDEYILILKKSD